MKVIIRFLANISGVEKEIRNEEKEVLILTLQSIRQWFSGKDNHRKHVFNCIDKMYNDCKKDIIPDASSLREYVDKKALDNDN